MADLGWFLVGGYKGWELAVVENIVYASLFGGNFSPRWFSLTQWIRNPQSESISIFISSYFKFWLSHPGLLLPYDIRLLFHKGGRCLLTERGCTLSETSLGTRKVSLPCFINFGMLYLAKKQDRQPMKAHLPINPKSGCWGTLPKPHGLFLLSQPLASQPSGWLATLLMLWRAVPKLVTLTSKLGSHISLTLRHTFSPTCQHLWSWNMSSN